MSYLSTGIDWTGDKVGSSTMSEEQPPWVKSFIAKYGNQVVAMREKFGIYPDRALIFPSNPTSFVPVTSAVNAWALATYWQQLGEDMLRQAMGQDQTTNTWYARLVQGSGGSRAPAAIEKVRPLVEKFKKDVASIGIGLSLIGFSSEESTAIKLWRLIREYANALSFAMWSGYNIESSFERAVWATTESAKEVGKAITDKMKEVLSVGDIVWKIVKWGTIGLVALAFGVGASKIIKKGRK